MLHVQDYLSSKSYDDLATELGIRLTRHETEPLVIVNYDQIDSPKTHPVVRECRGLVLNSTTNEIVARSFPRFFNWGEVQDEMKLFDFSDFCVQSKEDGSLVLLYHFNGQWRANTRGSFGLDTMQFQRFTWQEGFCKAMGISDLADLEGKLDPKLTYVCEFVSPWNKVVRTYSEPKMFLLTAFCGEEELHWNHARFTLPSNLFSLPHRYDFHSIEEVQDFLNKQGEEDPTFEGVVIRDKNNARWKIKNSSYLALHRLRGEGDNLYNPKNLLPFVLAGESSELLVYFPEVKEKFMEVKEKVEVAYAQMMTVWEASKEIPVQKDFALAILKKTPFTGILFDARKRGIDPKKLWRDGSDQIVKILF
jgi:hypothetical protein